MLTALSLLLPYFLGMGLAVAIMVPDLLPDVSLLRKGERGALLATLFAAGVLVNYLLVLLMGSIGMSLVTGGAIAVAGIVHGVVKLRGRLLHLLRLGWLWLPVLYLLMLYAIPLLLDPVSAGDARSIWFFHGKMIYYTGALGTETGLTAKSVEFSHVDYPKLIGILAAQFATMTGHWNEFVPKGGLVVLFLPLVLGTVSYFERVRFSSVYFLCLFFFGSGWYLWNGYMDGYLAVYAGLSLLFWGRWLAYGNSRDICGGFVFLGIAMNLKNEGILFALALAVALGLVLLLTKKSGIVQSVKRYAMIAVLPMLCIMVWSIKKSFWGLHNDLHLGYSSIAIVQRHLAEGAFSVIGKALIVDSFVGAAASVACIGLVAAAIFRVRIPVSVWFSLATGSLYFVGIFFIYLATPANLQWHLSTSAARTMMTVLTAFFAATYLILREMEDQGKERETCETSSSILESRS